MNTEKGERVRIEKLEIDRLAQILDRLPWPLMLQNSRGETLTQNSAWWQQIAVFKDSEAIGQEVETLFQNSFNLKIDAQATVKTQKSVGQEDLPALSQPRLGHSLRMERDYIHIEVAPTIGNSHCLPNTTASNRCQLGTQPGTCICILVGQNGQEQVWQFSKIPLNLLSLSTETDNHQSLLLATDITKEQQLLAELAVKNADLIQLNRLKDEFLACISHELKTPLTAVLGLSTLLQDRALGQLNERQARYAHLIHQSGRHLMMVVNDILDLTRMETGQMELTFESVQIQAVCHRALQQAKSSAAQSEIQPPKTGETLAQGERHHFNLEIESGLDSLVADQLRLGQMLIHLLANAFKFTDTGGEVGLRVSRCSGWIAFTIWDTGIGIPEYQQHLIFQKFQQLENPLTRQYKGAGLGLFLTRSLARLHGGDVSFLSQEGKGSQFTILLPPSPPLKIAEQSTLGDGSSRRLVLVVEAAPRFVTDLTEQLTSLGYQFAIARSGTEALEKARRLQPGVVLLNPLLPLLSGWDVLTLLKSDAVTSQIPIIVTATRADREQALLNRADDFLSLPVQQQSLQAIMEHFCHQSLPKQSIAQRHQTHLTILHLVDSHSHLPATSLLLGDRLGSTFNYRVLEADDLEQAELLARLWQPNVVLVAAKTSDPVIYIKQLCQYPNLKSLPLVTFEAATTEAAQVAGLSVFPYFTTEPNYSIDTLLPVLKIAAGLNDKPNLLVVDVTTLPNSPKSEWFQALIQYFKIAGLRAIIGYSWAQVLQQLRQQSIDLLLICLNESKLHPNTLAALKDLSQQHNLPPVLVLDRMNRGEVRPIHFNLEESVVESDVKSIEDVSVSDTIAQEMLGAIATQILPGSISIEELLVEVNQTLAKVEGIEKVNQPEIIIIAALAESNRVIAQDGKLPWKIPQDSQRFQELTNNYTVIMGRKTWENDLNESPLKNRNNIIISSKPQKVKTDTPLEPPFKLLAFDSVEAALEKSEEPEKIFVAGGAGIYAQTIEIADTLELTLVEGDFEGDTFFPEYKFLIGTKFELVAKEIHPGFRYETYKKIAQF